jgi:hypothetical protein
VTTTVSRSSYGQRVRVAHGWATLWPPLDFETYSEAGYVWNEDEQKWESLPGHSNQSRGLKAVGIRNYVEHPSFEVLCMAYDLLDGNGPKLWTPLRPWQPLDLLEHVRSGRILSAWNTEFEFTVWNYYCVPRLGWPPLALEQLRCDMSKSAANSYPRGLDPAGEALSLIHKKDPDGDRLVRKLTVPKNPTKKYPAKRWGP